MRFFQIFEDIRVAVHKIRLNRDLIVTIYLLYLADSREILTDHTAKSQQEFKKSFLAAESRNAANRANKTMQNRAIDDNEIADAIDYDAKSDDDLRASFG